MKLLFTLLLIVLTHSSQRVCDHCLCHVFIDALMLDCSHLPNVDLRNFVLQDFTHIILRGIKSAPSCDVFNSTLDSIQLIDVRMTDINIVCNLLGECEELRDKLLHDNREECSSIASDSLLGTKRTYISLS